MFESKKKETRFELVMSESVKNFGLVEILIDKVTGAHYVYTGSNGAAGLTVLVDETGQPMIDKNFKRG